MAMEQKPLGMEGLLLHGTVYEPAAAGRLAWRMAREVFAKTNRRAQVKAVPVKREARQECCGMEVCISTGK